MPDSLLTDVIKKEVLAQPVYAVKSSPCRIKMNQNESPWDWPEKLKREITSRLKDSAWNRYPDLRPVSLKEKLSEFLNVTADHIVVGKGSNEVLQALMDATLSAGDRLCTLSPTFAIYSLLAERRGAQVVISSLGKDFSVDAEDLVRKSAQAKLVILCNPNSPSGTLIEQDTISRIATSAPGIVVVDEAYVDFSKESALNLLAKYANLIIIRTLSKAFALAGFRLGYGIMHPALALEIQKCMLPFNVDLPSVLAAETLLNYPDIVSSRVERIIQERELWINELNQLNGVTAYPSKANFFLLSVPLPAQTVFGGLMEQGILVRDVSSYPGCEDLVRVTVGSPEENRALLNGVKTLI